MTDEALGMEAVPCELLARRARKDGRDVVTLRCSEEGAEYSVECDVYPVESLRDEPLRPGPYRFRSSAEAIEFVEEAMLALEYLGCDVS